MCAGIYHRHWRKSMGKGLSHDLEVTGHPFGKELKLDVSLILCKRIDFRNS